MYRIKQNISLVFVICLVLTLFLTPRVAVAATTTVSVKAPAEVAYGENFIARVAISDVVAFDAANFSVSFDSTVLEVTNVTSGMINGIIIPVDGWNLVNASTITIVQNVPGSTGVTGSGYLADIHFHVITSNYSTSPIDLHDGVLGNNLAQGIEATWEDDSITANVPTTYDLTMAKSGSGSTTPTLGTHTYDDGDVVPITATPAAGWQFVSWTGAVANNSSASTTVTMNANKTVTANFTLIPVTYDLTMAKNGSGTTTPTLGAHTYTEGTVVNISATPAAGWQFVSWTGAVANNSSASTTVTMNANKTVTANFTLIPVTYDLTMAKNGSGSTTPTLGAHTYTEGTVVNISATPAAGWEFDSWTGAVANNSSASTTVTMNANKTVTANFTLIPVTYDLTMAKNGSGSTTPTLGAHTYTEGTVVNISATPAAGWQFDSWTGAVANNSSASTTVTMNANKTVTANFTLREYTITFNSNGGSAVSPITQNYSSAVTPPANPTREGFNFAGWDPSVPATVPAEDITCVAQWTTEPVSDLAIAVSGNGTTTPSIGVHIYVEETVVNISANANSGWHFVNWSGDVADPNSATTTVTMNTDKTVTANFAIDTFTMAYTAGTGGTLIGQTSQTVNYGEGGTVVEAVAITGYHFVDWSDGSTANPRTDTGVTSDISVTANFSQTIEITYILTLAVSGKGAVIPVEGTQTYGEGTVVEITATPDSGWKFVYWTGAVADVSSANTTVTVDADKTVTAVFEVERDILAQQMVSPDSPATVSSNDDQIVVQFPANSVVGDTVVTIHTESQDSIPSCPAGFKAGATFFSVEMTSDLVSGTMVTITVKYSESDLEACGGDPNKLTLSRYDDINEEWVVLPTTIDAEAMTLTASTDRLSIWMVMVGDTLASEASDEGGTALWIWLVFIFGGLVGLVAIGSATILKRKRWGWHRVFSK